MAQTLVPTIHARGEQVRLDTVLDLVAFSARPRPLSTWLDEMPARIARVFGADICSIYLLEGDDLVMRGNVGFPATALGQVRLNIGEGITGRAVEYMRPMSLHAASSHESYRHFPGLGEERFPIFLAMPVAGPAGPLGALVLQRRLPPAFDERDIELAAALTAPIAAVAERAKLVDALHGSKKNATTGRRVTLSGRTAVAGRAWGSVCALPRPSRGGVDPKLPPAEAARLLDKAVSQARRTIEKLAQVHGAQGTAASRLQALSTILADARLSERTLERVADGESLGMALTRMASEVSRAATRSGEAFGLERAQEIAEVCEALAVLSSGAAPELPRRAVLIGDQFTVFDLLVSVRSSPRRWCCQSMRAVETPFRFWSAWASLR